MPIYEYVCSDCGHEFEKLQKMSDAPLRDCPACEHQSLKKKISAPGFRLSGSGWYETDFKSDKQKNLSKKDSAEKDSTSGSDKSADAKASKPSPEKKSSGKEAAA